MNNYKTIINNLKIKINEIEKLPNNTRVTNNEIGKYLGLTGDTMSTYIHSGHIPFERIDNFCINNKISKDDIYIKELKKYCKCKVELNNENTATFRANLKDNPMSICKSCKIKEDENKGIKTRTSYKIHPGIKICATENCDTVITKDTCYTKKYTCKDGTKRETTTSICKKCSNIKQRIRDKERRRLYLIDNPKPIKEVKKVVKPKRVKKPIIKKVDRVKKISKEKEKTLTKKLEKENVKIIPIKEVVTTVEPSEKPYSKMTGAERAKKVFQDQEDRRNRTQKQINEDKNKFIEWGIKR